MKREYAFDLKIIDIAKKPYLAEEYKLIVTPALVRISPLPKQIIAGANLVEQLKKLLPKWLATSHSSYSSQSLTKNSKESGSELNPIS
ncbi:MAG: histidine kinase, partial [Cyanobacteria bacterium J083]